MILILKYYDEANDEDDSNDDDDDAMTMTILPQGIWPFLISISKVHSPQAVQADQSE